VTEAAERDRDVWRRRATYASVGVALTLIGMKLAAFLASGSVSLLSSLIDSSVDLMASIVILFGVARALQPPDLMHRFGHGKAEPLAAMAQGAFVCGSAVFLGYEAISRFVDPQAVEETELGIVVMLLSILLTLMLVLFQRWVIARTGSLAIDADSLHYRGDLVMNLAVIASLLLTRWSGSPYWDPAFALAIAAFLVWGAQGIVRSALDVLMDRELPDRARDEIVRLVLANPETRGMHDLRTRSTGLGEHVEFHLELDPELSLARAHDITDAIERTLRAAFPNAEFTIHQEPAGLEDERLDHRLRNRRQER